MSFITALADLPQAIFSFFSQTMGCGKSEEQIISVACSLCELVKILSSADPSKFLCSVWKFGACKGALNMHETFPEVGEASPQWKLCKKVPEVGSSGNIGSLWGTRIDLMELRLNCYVSFLSVMSREEIRQDACNGFSHWKFLPSPHRISGAQPEWPLGSWSPLIPFYPDCSAW